MLNLFIDANIWLALYDFASDDLEIFKKLEELMEHDVTIILPEQTKNEVWRNREIKIKTALAQFEKWDLQIPNLCKGYGEYREFLSLIKQARGKHSDLVNQIKKDAIEKTLAADALIEKMFAKSSLISMNEDIYSEAKMRFDIGNPPGKDKSYGDALNWVSVLKYAPAEDFFFISNDKDYRSPVDDKSLNRFIYDEWYALKKSNIYLYRTLNEFFKNHLQDIDLQTEKEKNEYIEMLNSSRNFATTHNIIGKLSTYNTWTTEQIVNLCSAVRYNSQVGCIIGDDDVFNFFEKLLSDTTACNCEEIDYVNEKIANIKKENEKTEDIVDDDLPF